MKEKIRPALGYAFTIKELFWNFPISKLESRRIDLNAYVKDRHKRAVAVKIFQRCIEVIIQDVAVNNVQFNLPPVYGTHSYIYLKRVSGE